MNATRFLFAVVGLGAFLAAPVKGFDCDGCRLVYRTVYDEERVTAYRLTYETAVEEREVTTLKPEWVCETKQRTYRVCKPVAETSTRNEVHRVMRPVMETETRYQQQCVRRPVTETVMQNENVLTCEPVTTMRTQYVDQGGYVDQCVQTPGTTRNRLQWLPGAYFVDPRTGTQVYHRGGLHWAPQTTPGTSTVMRTYVPNIVAQQVPQTSYVQKVVTQQKPVQVTRYVDEVVQQPYQVQVQKWVAEEVTKPVTVTSYRYEFEDRVEDYQVQSMRWVSQVNKVQVPHTVAKWVPYTTTRLVPRTVCERVPVNPCDPCATTGSSIGGTTTYYAPLSPSIPPIVVPATPPVPGAAAAPVTEMKPGDSQSNSVLKQKANEPTEAKSKSTDAEKSNGEKSNGADPKDSDPIDKPSLEPVEPGLNSAAGDNEKAA